MSDIFGSIFGGFFAAFQPFILQFVTPVLTPVAGLLVGGSTALVGFETVYPIIHVVQFFTSRQFMAVILIFRVIFGMLSVLINVVIAIAEVVALVVLGVFYKIPIVSILYRLATLGFTTGRQLTQEHD